MAIETATSQLRERPLATRESKPHFPPYVRMQHDRRRDRKVVLAPERVFWPDEVAIDIITLCNGNRTIAEIANQLASDYHASPDIIEADIVEFVQSWTDIRLLRL